MSVKRGFRRRDLVYVFLVVAVVLLAHYFGDFLITYTLRRTGSCPIQRAFAVDHLERAQLARMLALERTSRIIASDDSLELWETNAGNYWIPRGSSRRDGGIFVILAEQDRDVYGSALIHPGDVVLDCGANVGAFSRKALAAGAGLVVAVEPVPANVECLRRNLSEQIQARRAVVYPKGVWDKDDILPMSQNVNSGTDSFIGDVGTHAINLPLTTIDRAVNELGLSRVDWIKMDVEGAEARALAGAAATIKRFHPRLIISTEHSINQEYEVTSLVAHRWPEYKVECGACRSFGTFRIAPEVMLFQVK